MSKSTILLILGAVAIIVLAVASFAVYRNRQESGSFNIPSFSGSDQQSNQSSRQQDSDNQAQSGSSPGDGAVCGDGQCTGSETVERCYSDCISYDIFFDVQVTDTNDDSVLIEWTTARPMTTSLDFGHSREYELGSREETGFRTSHSIELTNLEAPNAYYIRLRGIDEAGQEESFRGPSFEI